MESSNEKIKAVLKARLDSFLDFMETEDKKRFSIDQSEDGSITLRHEDIYLAVAAYHYGQDDTFGTSGVYYEEVDAVTPTDKKFDPAFDILDSSMFEYFSFIVTITKGV